MLSGISTITKKRLQKELREMTLDPPFGVSGSPLNSDLATWSCIIIGPVNTPYSGGVFKIRIKFPVDYPFKPPRVKFKTKIYHCNVGKDGNICLDILKKRWKPNITVSGVLVAVQQLLRNPNANSPLIEKYGNMLLRSPKKYKEMAEDWTARFAK